MTHKGWCVVKHQTNKQKQSREVKYGVYFLSDFFKTNLIWQQHDLSVSLLSLSTGIHRFSQLSTVLKPADQFLFRPFILSWATGIQTSFLKYTSIYNSVISSCCTFRQFIIYQEPWHRFSYHRSACRNYCVIEPWLICLSPDKQPQVKASYSPRHSCKTTPFKMIRCVLYNAAQLLFLSSNKDGHHFCVALEKLLIETIEYQSKRFWFRQYKFLSGTIMSQSVRFWYLSEGLGEPGQMRKSLRHSHTQIMGVNKDRPNFRPLAQLDSSTWVFKGFLCMWVLISCTG